MEVGDLEVNAAAAAAGSNASRKSKRLKKGALIPSRVKKTSLPV